MMGHTNSSSFSKHYKTGKVIGCGAFATVKKCIRRCDKSEYAVKIVSKNALTYSELDALSEEIAISRALQKHNHPHLISMREVFESERKVKIVFELCQEKDLFDVIYEAPDSRLNERKTARLIATIAKSLKYLHQNVKITHRDLKPGNILFAKKDGTLKIADFGSAFMCSRSRHKSDMKTQIGTPLYLAPEIILGRAYSNMVDLWSLGVILYVCLSGYHPFCCSQHKFILNGTYQFPSPLWDNIDVDAIDLIRKLLTVDVKKRITCDGVMCHKWIAKHV